jgi:hypothetical protein
VIATGESGLFRRTGGMLTDRQGATATLLADGMVLITGGSTSLGGTMACDGGAESLLSSAELYDPGTGAFVSTGAMGAARCGHTATLLSDGRVLVTGGCGSDGSGATVALATSEIWDPGTGDFSATGSMQVAREYQTATLLTNGDVLVVGGDQGELASGTRVLSSAEMYDPARGVFTPTGSLRDARSAHTASLLGNGDVLIAGGLGASESLDSLELYVPAEGLFQVASRSPFPLEGHTATVLETGLVLLAGGWDPALGQPQRAAEIFDPGSGRVVRVGDMGVGRIGHTATLLSDGKVLVVGGDLAAAGGVSGSLTGAVSSAEVFDPSTGSFAPAGSLSSLRWGHTATLLQDGRVLVSGGDLGSASGVAELFSERS